MELAESGLGTSAKTVQHSVGGDGTFLAQKFLHPLKVRKFSDKTGEPQVCASAFFIPGCLWW